MPVVAEVGVEMPHEPEVLEVHGIESRQYSTNE